MAKRISEKRRRFTFFTQVAGGPDGKSSAFEIIAAYLRQLSKRGRRVLSGKIVSFLKDLLAAVAAAAITLNTRV